MIAKTLLYESRRWGVTLTRRGDKLAIRPAFKCPPELLALLREQKSEVLSLLEAREIGLPVSSGQWLHIARQILAGEFDGADNSTVQSLTIGLRGIPHKLCQQALIWVKGMDGSGGEGKT